MARRLLLVNGPPGAGKSRVATHLAQVTARQYGPSAVAGVTFTRTAAAELRSRIGAALGFGHLSASSLRKTIPYAGTLHSLAWQLLGRPEVVTASHLRQFARDINSSADFRVLRRDASPEITDSIAFEQASSDMSEVELMATLLSGVRHRFPDETTPFDRAQEIMPPTLPAGTSMDRLRRIAAQYADWKASRGVYDFDDMVYEARHHTLPVRVIIADESQDLTPLLWTLLDAWASRAETLICLGDVYQALYSWAGAAAHLFRDRPGEWLRLKDAHRFDAPSGEYAKAVLRLGGYNTPRDEEFHASWTGVGDAPTDGSVAYLARTHALLEPFETELQEHGVPYAKLRGRAPLQTTAAFEFKEMRRGERKAYSATARAYLRANPYVEDYFGEVWSAHGEEAFTRPPQAFLGTVHAAKGLSFDTVHLVRSWGILPARNAREKPQEEACVAYVAASRHRKRLIFEEGDGLPYAFPPVMDLNHA